MKKLQDSSNNRVRTLFIGLKTITRIRYFAKEVSNKYISINISYFTFKQRINMTFMNYPIRSSKKMRL